MNIVLILPNQLFEDNKLIGKNSQIYLCEHPFYFTGYKYHKLKLILHRSSMKHYEDHVNKKYHCDIKYLEFNDEIEKVFKQNHGKRIDIYDPVDHDIMKEFKKLSNKYDVELFVHDTPLFLCTIKDLTDYIDQGGKYHQTSFYIWQRKRINILVDNNDKPIGGKWTYDTENRLPYPKGFHRDMKIILNDNHYVKEAKEYIEKHFKDNYGETDFYLPIDFQGVKKHLIKFLKDRLECFGPYQDAVDKDIIFGCHTVLSPLINIGLITPEAVINMILDYYEKHKRSVKLASIEALIRQIMGWRECVRMVYMFKHKEMNTMNHFNHHRKIGKEWYIGKTSMEPIDDLIKKVLKYGYAHHIERLMYLGNFMLLNEFSPKQVYEWFMTLFIDAYSWVMDANVYAMSQYSTGNLLMTRPYFSSSNYIDKMSSYTRTKDQYKKIIFKDKEYEWFEVWDALYYNFVNNHKVEFAKNYALASAVSHWNKKSASVKKDLMTIAKKYLDNY